MKGLLCARLSCFQPSARAVIQPVHFCNSVVTRQINTVSGASDINNHDQRASISATSKGRRRRPNITPKERLARFNELLAFVTPRLGRRPDVKTPQVRQSAWTHLLRFAATPEQLEKVTALFPRWTDSRRVFDTHHAEILVRRCQQLHCPGLALKVFGDHSKYGLALSLPAARNLLHALHVEHPLADTLSAAALFCPHGLRAPSEDLVSCAMLVSACFAFAHKQKIPCKANIEGAVKPNTKHGDNAMRVAEALVPSLRRLLNEEGPVTVPKDAVKREQPKQRPKVWLMRTMEKIERALAARGSENEWEWLRDWRIRSRHIPSST